MWGTILTLSNPPEGGGYFGWEMVTIAVGVNASGLVLGILALARPGHGHGQRPRRTMAWTAIGLSLVSFTGLGLILLAL